MITIYNHKMILCLDLLDQINVDFENAQLNTIALFGRTIDDKDLYNTAMERHSQKNTKGSLQKTPRALIKTIQASGNVLKNAREHYGNYRLPIKEFETSQQLFNFLVLRCTDLRQTLIGRDNNDKEKKKSISISELLSTSIPFNKLDRELLEVYVRLLRTAVQNREASKSVMVRGIDAWRKGYVRLSQLMVSEGRIPDADLMFFMTLDEIRELLATRSPKVISKAAHRKRRYPVLYKYIFPEISKDFPSSMNMDSSPEVDDDFVMKGAPTSLGVAEGYIRVALNLDEASHLKRGEILVAYCTDIGWSPYFPILAGVVTELGGLISHGAVVSREFGIPCMIALHGAIINFKTGDYALNEIETKVSYKCYQIHA